MQIIDDWGSWVLVSDNEWADSAVWMLELEAWKKYELKRETRKEVIA